MISCISIAIRRLIKPLLFMISSWFEKKVIILGKQVPEILLPPSSVEEEDSEADWGEADDDGGGRGVHYTN